MANRRLLISGGSVITVDPSLGDLPQADILVEDGKISAIGVGLEAADADVLDARDFIVLPGLIDTHRHTWQSVVRHRMGDADLLQYRKEILSGMGPRFRPSDVYIGNLLGVLAAVESGTTTLLDWSHIQNTPDHSDAAIAALRDSGIRAVFAHGWPRTDGAAWAMDSTRPHPDDIRRIRRDVLSSDDDLVTLALAARGPEMATMDITRHDFQLARELGIRTTMHVGIRGMGAKYRAVERMHCEGLLGPDLTLIHMCECSDDELKMTADAGVSTCIGPHATMTMDGVGVMPIGRLLAAGIRPSLSGDTESCACGDMFNQMRFALAGHRYVRNNNLTPRQGPDLRVRDVLEFATLVGAEACGLGHRVGSLRPAKDADIIFVRRTDLNLAPVSDAVGAVVLGAHPGNVDTVMVRGKILKQGGKMIGYDLDRVRALAAASQSYLLG
ncbi:amidohydrolase family protein [Roseiarcaceae bacterium H3SJ34-1]|uniref:amidohydrolase family protein n=1 Tax=Terripilifer ovatus TaxID=3032367 RepID=UPI003AB97505|nr:amidohydrolase family protein [Roseiarcaceae bacterium H3SJ34-1]